MKMKQREAVMWFADQMERKLSEHDDRPGWENEPYDYLLSRLKEEVFELDSAKLRGTTQERIDECADVANFAMMIADNLRKIVWK